MYGKSEKRSWGVTLFFSAESSEKASKRIINTNGPSSGQVSSRAQFSVLSTVHGSDLRALLYYYFYGGFCVSLLMFTSRREQFCTEKPCSDHRENLIVESERSPRINRAVTARKEKSECFVFTQAVHFLKFLVPVVNHDKKNKKICFHLKGSF